MSRSLSIATFVFLAMVIGWVVGRAQSANPDFELVVTAPGGETSVECVRGCDLNQS